MEIAVVYICTGKYSIFWPGFHKTCTRYFYPDARKHFFVFTDDEALLRSFKEDGDITGFFQKKAGWPYDTLLRFNSFCTIQDILKGYDYCYWWNANSVFIKPIDESVIPLPDEGRELVLWRHTMTYHDDIASRFTVERNPLSTAYIPEGAKCHGYGGGFFGGTADGFLKMARTLRDNVARDLANGIVAVWHDESHIQRYAMDMVCQEVPENVIVSEEYAEGRNPCAMFLNKDNFGGNDKLRELPFRIRMRNKFFRLKRRICHYLTKNR